MLGLVRGIAGPGIEPEIVGIGSGVAGRAAANKIAVDRAFEAAKTAPIKVQFDGIAEDG